MKRSVIVAAALAIPLLLLAGAMLDAWVAAVLAIIMLAALYLELQRVRRQRG